mgnify:CR=1 FL=1
MHKGFDQELDHLISTGLRNETGFNPAAMNAVRGRLLANAAQQTMLPAVPVRRRRFFSLDMILGFMTGWIYALLYEETCYDRARILPDRAIGHESVWAHTFHRYMFMRPAF